MTEYLFENDKHLKLCLRTLFEKDGLLDRRKLNIHETFQNLEVDGINNKNYFEMIGKSKEYENNYIFIYLFVIVILIISIYFVVSLITKAFKLSDIKIKY